MTILASSLMGAMSGPTLESVLVEHQIPLTTLSDAERQQAITSFAVSKPGPVFLVAYHDDAGTQQLDPFIHVFRFDKKTGHASRVVLKSTETPIDPAGSGLSSNCMGSALSVFEDSGLIEISTHINPSAGCVLLLDSDLHFKAALPGWVLGRVGNQLIRPGNSSRPYIPERETRGGGAFRSS